MIKVKYEKFPIVLAGCRTTEYALECCEYNFVIMLDQNLHELLHANDILAEIHSVRTKPDLYEIAPALQNMQVINDPSWTLAALKQDITAIMPKALSLYTRNRIVDALLYANRSRGMVNSNAQMASLWLKCAAYYYLEGVIAKNGSKPMPTHMLSQLRSINESEGEGIAIASTCLGLERANRSSVSRSVEASIELNNSIAKTHFNEIVARKAQFLFQSGMYTDCYFYLGYIARNAAVMLMSDQKALKNYMFMLNIAMDLNTDPSFIIKFSNGLIDSCNALLVR